MYKHVETHHSAGPAKWILKWRGHGTLTSIVDHMVGRPEKLLNSRRFRMTKTVPFWPW